MKYIIIGAGIAGTTAAEELRKRDPSAEITLVSEEQHPLYSRVLLPHYLKEKISRDRVFLKKESWYGEHNIEWLQGILCTHIDPRNKFVGLSDAREISYDKLLIATGGEVRNIDADIRGVSYLRTLDDADHLNQLVAEYGNLAQAGIYGGGFIACEYLNFFAHHKISTSLFYRGAHFWPRVLVSQSGELLAKHLVDHGVHLHPHTAMKHLLGEKELTGILTTAGEHQLNILGVGIGIEPDLSWIASAGCEVHMGIRANEYLETSIPDIFVAGDIAEFFDPILQRHIQIGNWMNAMTQGRVVAKTMSGERTRFELVSSYSTNALGLEIIFVGDVEKVVAQEIHVLGSIEQGGITQLFERDKRIVGGILIGRNQDRKAITEGIFQKKTIPEVMDKLTNWQK